MIVWVSMLDFWGVHLDLARGAKPTRGQPQPATSSPSCWGLIFFSVGFLGWFVGSKNQYLLTGLNWKCFKKPNGRFCARWLPQKPLACFKLYSRHSKGLKRQWLGPTPMVQQKYPDCDIKKNAWMTCSAIHSIKLLGGFNSENAQFNYI